MAITDTRDMVLVHRVFRREFRLLPLMVRAVADGDAAMADRMEAQHKVIGGLLARAETALPAWQRAPRADDGHALAADLDELHARLEEHLDDEETHVLPFLGQTITPAEWDELAERGFAAMPKTPRPGLRRPDPRVSQPRRAVPVPAQARAAAGAAALPAHRKTRIHARDRRPARGPRPAVPRSMKTLPSVTPPGL